MDPRQLEALAQRLAQNPGDTEALNAAYTHGQTDPRGYAIFLEKTAAASAEAAYAAHWFVEAANVWTASLGDAHRAVRALMAAVERDPTHDGAAEALAAIYRERSDQKGVVALLDRRAKLLEKIAPERPEVAPAAAAVLVELAQIQAESLGRPEAALQSYKRAATIHPGDPYAIYMARELLKNAGKYTEALPYFALEQALVVDDPERAVALYLDEAEVSRNAGDQENLLRALRSARALDRNDDPTLKQQLATITFEKIQAGEAVAQAESTEAAELFVSLAETYDGDYGLSYASCALTADPENDRALQLALHYAETLGRSAELGPFAASYLARQPTGVMAEAARALVMDLLSRTYDEALIAALQPSPDSDPEVRAEAWVELGRIHARHARHSEAERSYQEAAHARPAHLDAIHYLAETFHASHRNRELRDLYVRAAGDVTAALGDRIRWLEEVAALAEGPLADLEGAVEARRQLVLLDPTDEAAADHLESVLEEASRWDELAELVARRADLTTDPELQLSRLKTLVEIHREKRQDPTQAAHALGRVAKLDPEEPEHAETALRLCAQAKEPELAIQLLIDLMGLSLSDEVRGKYSQRLGDLLRARGDHRGAGGAYAEAAGLSHDSRLWGLAEAEFQTAEAWEMAARAVHERVQLAGLARDQAALLSTEASYLDRLGDSEGAIVRLKEAMALAPEERTIFEALEQRYMEARTFGPLADLLIERARSCPDPTEQAELFRRAATVHKDELRNDEGMRQALRHLLDYQEDESALTVLADDAEQNGDLAAAVDYLSRLQRVSQTTDLGKLALRLAGLLADMGDEGAALEQYNRALEHRPDDLDARAEKAALEKRLGEFEASAQSYKILTEKTEGELRLGYALELALLLEEHLADLRGAFDALQLVHHLDPTNFEVLEKLARLSGQVGEWESFVRYQQELIDVEGDDDEAARLGLRLAEVLIEELGRKQEAMQTLVPFARGGSEEARTRFIELGDELDEPGFVASSLRDWLKDAPPGPRRNQGLRAAFDRFIRAQDDAHALEMGLILVRMRGVDLELARTLEGLARAATDLEALQAAFTALGRDLEGDARALEFVRQAEILAQSGMTESEAIAHGEQALASADSYDIESLLERLARLTSNKLERVALYERRVLRAKTQEERQRSLCRAAEVALGYGERAKAIELLTLALASVGPDDGLDALVLDITKSDEANATQEMRLALLDVLALAGKEARDGGRTRSLYLRRGALLAFQELGDSTRAASFFEESLVAQVDDETVEAIEHLADTLGRVEEADKIFGRALERIHDGPQLRALLRRRYDLRSTRLDNPQGAAEDLKRLYELSPGDTDIAAQLETYYEQNDDTRGLVQLFEDRILRSRDSNLRSELARRVAWLWQDKLRNPRETADAWRRVLRLNPADTEAKEHLERAKLEMRKVTAADLTRAEEEERRRLAELEKIEALARRAEAEEAERVRKEKEEKLKARLSESLPPPPSIDTPTGPTTLDDPIPEESQTSNDSNSSALSADTPSSSPVLDPALLSGQPVSARDDGATEGALPAAAAPSAAEKTQDQDVAPEDETHEEEPAWGESRNRAPESALPTSDDEGDSRHPETTESPKPPASEARVEESDDDEGPSASALLSRVSHAEPSEKSNEQEPQGSDPSDSQLPAAFRPEGTTVELSPEEARRLIEAAELTFASRRAKEQGAVRAHEQNDSDETTPPIAHNVAQALAEAGASLSIETAASGDLNPSLDSNQPPATLEPLSLDASAGDPTEEPLSATSAAEETEEEERLDVDDEVELVDSYEAIDVVETDPSLRGSAPPPLPPKSGIHEAPVHASAPPPLPPPGGTPALPPAGKRPPVLPPPRGAPPPPPPAAGKTPLGPPAAPSKRPPPPPGLKKR